MTANGCPDPPPDANVAEVASFYVLPVLWGQGIGRELMTAALRTLASADFGEASLHVWDGNRRAIAFYIRLGWTWDGSESVDEIGDRRLTSLRYRHELVRRRPSS
jgi:ribosomal protein S18 acetylase RimI-like enzyme